MFMCDDDSGIYGSVYDSGGCNDLGLFERPDYKLSQGDNVKCVLGL